MNFENYTDRAKGLIQAAQTIALREGHQQIIPAHILKALLDDEEGLAANLIKAAGGNPRLIADKANEAIDKLPKVEGDGAQLMMAQSTARLFARAEEVAKKSGDSFVTTERLLLALSMEKEFAPWFEQAGVAAQALNGAINDLRKGRTADSASAEQAYDALKKYARDLT